MKEKLSLISDKSNIVNISQSRIDDIKIDPEELHNIKIVLKMMLVKTKGTITYDMVAPHIENDLKLFDFVLMKDYPLAAVFNLETRRILVNISALGRRSIENIETRDLYSLLVYSITIAYFSGTRKIQASNARIYADFFNAIMLKLFSKSYGLTGSYMELIPEMRFFTNLYVLVSFFDYPQKDAINLAASLSKYNIKKLNLELSKYNFYDIKDYIKTLSDSGVMPGLSIYMFVKKMLVNFGILNITLFEDIVRFNATMMASVVNGNSLFVPHIQIYHPDLYKRILEAISKSI